MEGFPSRKIHITVLLIGGLYVAYCISFVLNGKKNDIVTGIFTIPRAQQSKHGDLTLTDTIETHHQSGYISVDDVSSIPRASPDQKRVESGSNKPLTSQKGLKFTTNSSRPQSGSGVSPAIQPDRKPIKVLLVAYFRGGSSFFGELFNRNPEAIYWYEPLRVHAPGGLTPPQMGLTAKSGLDIGSDM